MERGRELERERRIIRDRRQGACEVASPNSPKWSASGPVMFFESVGPDFLFVRPGVARAVACTKFRRRDRLRRAGQSAETSTSHVFPVTRKRNFGAANLSGGDENCLKLEGNSMRSRGANQPLKRKFAPQRCRRIRA